MPGPQSDQGPRTATQASGPLSGLTQKERYVTLVLMLLIQGSIIRSWCA